MFFHLNGIYIKFSPLSTLKKRYAVEESNVLRLLTMKIVLHREVIAEYSDCMNSLAQKLLGLISESLGLPSSCIKDHVGEFYQNITVCYYPPCPQPDLTLGLQSHSDMGALTLLIQDDVGGLQVFKNGEWITVPPLRDGILVLLADQTEVFQLVTFTNMFLSYIYI